MERSATRHHLNVVTVGLQAASENFCVPSVVPGPTYVAFYITDVVLACFIIQAI